MKKKKSYRFTDKRHSDRAVMGVVLGVVSLVSLGGVVLMSYLRAGDVGARCGVAAFLAAVYSVAGLVLGLKTVQEKNYYRLVPVLAILLNSAALLGVALILYMGAQLG